MQADSYLHNLKDFRDLIQVVSSERRILPQLIEKDYWIMHVLYGLARQGFVFELKGGTSLSKGYRIIERFSEDIDIRIEPPGELKVMAGRNHQKPAHVDSRRRFFDWLAENIHIPGIESVHRDHEFDDDQFRGAGIRLIYPTTLQAVDRLKPGILLEVGFDDTTPNKAVDISSWALDKAATSGVKFTDNRALQVKCYHPAYTLVEKLQAVSTKFRQQQESGGFPVNFLRHYYDIYCLWPIRECRSLSARKHIRSVRRSVSARRMSGVSQKTRPSCFKIPQFSSFTHQSTQRPKGCIMRAWFRSILF